MIRGPRGQRLFDGSPGLIAVFRALRRLLAPRHPPHALSSLAALTPRPPRPRGHQTSRPVPHATVAPRLARGGRVSNDPWSLSQAHAEKHSQLYPPPEVARGLSRWGGVVMQLLPLPYCQRTPTTSVCRRGRLVKK